jgi:hypothetical protein
MQNKREFKRKFTKPQNFGISSFPSEIYKTKKAKDTSRTEKIVIHSAERIYFSFPNITQQSSIIQELEK